MDVIRRAVAGDESAIVTLIVFLKRFFYCRAALGIGKPSRHIWIFGRESDGRND
jgi:hypothetical protein